MAHGNSEMEKRKKSSETKCVHCGPSKDSQMTFIAKKEERNKVVMCK